MNNTETFNFYLNSGANTTVSRVAVTVLYNTSIGTLQSVKANAPGVIQGAVVNPQNKQNLPVPLIINRGPNDFILNACNLSDTECTVPVDDFGACTIELALNNPGSTLNKQKLPLFTINFNNLADGNVVLVLVLTQIKDVNGNYLVSDEDVIDPQNPSIGYELRFLLTIKTLL